MKQKYSKSLLAKVKQEMVINPSNVEIAEKFGIPAGTIGQWRHTYKAYITRQRSKSDKQVDVNKRIVDEILVPIVEAEIARCKRKANITIIVAYVLGAMLGLSIGLLLWS